jgi:hypothetical protein
MSACLICDGVGLIRIANPEGEWVSQVCECQEKVRTERRLFAARIPERYREPTLGDRIGDRMRSRLAEMCIRVEMAGEDFRQTVKRASFG